MDLQNLGNYTNLKSKNEEKRELMMENEEDIETNADGEPIKKVPMNDLVEYTLEEERQKKKVKSQAYEIYKDKVGITMNGDPMKNLNELPYHIIQAWKEIDWYYHEKIRNLHQQIHTFLMKNFLENFYEEKQVQEEKEYTDEEIKELLTLKE